MRNVLWSWSQRDVSAILRIKLVWLHTCKRLSLEAKRLHIIATVCEIWNWSNRSDIDGECQLVQKRTDTSNVRLNHLWSQVDWRVRESTLEALIESERTFLKLKIRHDWTVLGDPLCPPTTIWVDGVGDPLSCTSWIHHRFQFSRKNESSARGTFAQSVLEFIC